MKLFAPSRYLLGAVCIYLSLCISPSNSLYANTTLTSDLHFEQYIGQLYLQCNLKNRGIDKQLFRHAMIGYYNLLEAGKVAPDKQLLSIIDFRKPSDQQRFYVIDLAQKKVIFQTLVSHGQNTGLLYARYFSNKPESFQSSLGWFITAESYHNSANGHGMRLDGLEEGYNDNARSRNIVVHAAPYVCKTYIEWHGSLGRSQGCPTLPEEANTAIIDLIKDGTCLFQYYDDLEYLNNSKYMSSQAAAKYFASLQGEKNVPTKTIKRRKLIPPVEKIKRAKIVLGLSAKHY